MPRLSAASADVASHQAGKSAEAMSQQQSVQMSPVAMAKVHKIRFELLDYPPYTTDQAGSDFLFCSVI
ncbi:hypothetical protein J6590_092632 [Homalodisca vitripennis]|nr:hypothetical protein J6590_092632 [Homalodisca vitripennis]